MAQEFAPQPGLFVNTGKWERKAEANWSFGWSEEPTRLKAALRYSGTVVDEFTVPRPGDFQWRFLPKAEFLVIWFTFTGAPKHFRLYLYDLRGVPSPKPRYEWTELRSTPISATYPEARLVVHSSGDNKALFYYITGGLPNETRSHHVVRTDTGATLCSWGSILPASATEIQRLARFTDDRRVQICTSPSSRPGGLTIWADEPLPPASLPDVQIVRVNAAPAGPDVDKEYVRIRNNGGTAVDMTGWTLVDNEGHTFTFPTFSLAASATVEVWTTSGENTGERLYMGRAKAVWTNTGDVARLLNAAGDEVSRLQVTPGGTRPAPPVSGPPDVPMDILDEVLVDVHESDGDVDTGLDIAAGELWTVSATGEIYAGVWFTGQNGPDGWDQRTTDPKFPLHTGSHAHPFALLGRLGADGPYFFVGDSYRSLPHSGQTTRLFLRINDDTPGNGSGSFRVLLRRQRPRDDRPVPRDRELILEKRITVREADHDVDTGIELTQGQIWECTASGKIWAGVVLTGENGPEGWDRLDYDPKFPLHSGTYARPFALLGRFAGQPYFYIGRSHVETYRARASRRLYLRINDDTPGNGSGHFDAVVKVYRRGPDNS